VDSPVCAGVRCRCHWSDCNGDCNQQRCEMLRSVSGIGAYTREMQMKRLVYVLVSYLSYGVLRWWCLAQASGAWVPNKPVKCKLERSVVAP